MNSQKFMRIHCNSYEIMRIRMNAYEFIGIPMNCYEFVVIHRNYKEFLRIHRNSQEFVVIPESKWLKIQARLAPGHLLQFVLKDVFQRLFITSVYHPYTELRSLDFLIPFLRGFPQASQRLPASPRRILGNSK